MFCCSICQNLFCGIHPEIVVTTRCGHIFHYKCILLCLKKTSKCPFCSLRVEKTQLIKLHLQIDANWKDTAAALNIKPNTSIINLDETRNDTLNLYNNSSVIVNEPEDLVTMPKSSSSFFYKLEQNLKIYDSKTLLTASSPTTSLTKKVQSMLSIFSDILPNSRIQTCVQNIIQYAFDEKFTNILMINVQNGCPTGITFIDLSKNSKIYASIKHLKCNEYKNIVRNEIEDLRLITKCDKQLNKSQEFVLNFFTKIFPKRSETSHHAITTRIMYCDNCQALKFEHGRAGLSFCLVL